MFVTIIFTLHVGFAVIDLDDCSTNPCVNGTCYDLVNDYLCVCDDGYNGTNCDIDINECDDNPCINGNCTDGINGYSCSCNSGFTGDRCETGELVKFTFSLKFQKISKRRLITSV